MIYMGRKQYETIEKGKYKMKEPEWMLRKKKDDKKAIKKGQRW